MNKQSLRVGTLGKGSYAEKAALEYIDYIGLDAELVHCDSKPLLVELVADGGVDVGTLPIENTYGGFVRPALRLLKNNPVWIVDEWKVEINHFLACRKESLDNILKKKSSNETVEFHTHTQAWEQTELYNKEVFPKCLFNPAASTAKGAENISELDQYEQSVAVCSEYAAKLYDLEIIKRNLVPGLNETRFLIISNEMRIPEDNHNKGLVICELKHKGGALDSITDVFWKKHGLNMTGIPGMPTGERLGSYRFYIEFEVDKYEIIKELLVDLKDHTISLDFKGYYKNLNNKK